jgi:hypothetical protein
VSKRSRRPLQGAKEFWLRRRDLRLSAPGGRLFSRGGWRGRPRGSVHHDGHRRPSRGEQPAEARFQPGESCACPPGEEAGAPYSVAEWASRSIWEAAAPSTQPAVGSPRAGATTAAAPTGQRPRGERAAPAEPARWHLAAWGTARWQGCTRSEVQYLCYIVSKTV